MQPTLAELATSIRITASKFGDHPRSWDPEGTDLLARLEVLAREFDELEEMA
jgi:hypothetical protein